MRERFHTLVIGAAVLAVSAFAPLAAQDDVSHVRIVRLSFIQGSVTLQPTGAGDRAARLYEPVQEGFLLRTHADSFAEVEFENGSTARLGEDSEIFFEQLALARFRRRGFEAICFSVGTSCWGSTMAFLSRSI